MAQSPALVEIKEAVQHLCYEERLLLIEWLAHGLRSGERHVRPDWAAELAAMAADPEMQRELAQIAQEFAPTEADGLEQL